MVETNGSDTKTIPSTHPWRVQNLTFQRPENVIGQYADIKSQENSDLYIALTHIGFNGGNNSLGDTQIAEQYPYFDLIIGGHSHQKINTTINNIPIFQSGANLNGLGKIELTIKDKTVQAVNYELIDLNAYSEYDSDLKVIIDDYNDLPYLNEVIGYSHLHHNKPQVGCFYTDALKGAMNVDVTFQNTGGVRSILNKGDIIMFDEFNVPVDEFKAFKEWTESFYIEYEVLGEVNNYYQIAIKIK